MLQDTTVVIDRCAPEDCTPIALMARRIWGEWANGMPLTRQLLELGHPVFVAKNSDGQLIGYVVGLAEAFGSGAWILSLTVGEEHRRKGIGRRLVSAILESYRQQNVTWVGAVISANNSASQSLFRTFGFTNKEILHNYDPEVVHYRFEVVFHAS